jgi:hypothetical protein
MDSVKGKGMFNRTIVTRTAAVGAFLVAFGGTTASASMAAQPTAAPSSSSVTAASQSWAIVDSNDIQHSTLTWNAETKTGMACYASTSDVVIQAQTTSGQVLKRLVPERGCTVVMAYGGTGDITAVGALVGDFENPWHEVA